MNKDFVRGINFSLGFLFIFGIVGLVYAVGFHSANEILSGNFTGNFSFENNVNFNGNVNFSNAQVEGIQAQGTLNYVEFNQTGIHNFSIPENVDLIFVTLVGSSGGGGGGSYSTWKGHVASGGAGGFGGFVTNFPLFTNGNTNFSVTIGLGGTGGTSRISSCPTGNPGTSGDSTQFRIENGALLLQATGGQGGTGGTANCGSNTPGNGVTGTSGTPTPNFYNSRYGARGSAGYGQSGAVVVDGSDGNSGYARISWYS